MSEKVAEAAFFFVKNDFSLAHFIFYGELCPIFFDYADIQKR